MESSRAKFNKNDPKPNNIFYVWYTELCRRMNFAPAPVVKPAKLKSQTILEFVGDRLKVDDWTPIVKALRNDTSLHAISIKSRLSKCEFLHDVDTEEKAKGMKRKFGSVWTAYVVQQLTKSLSTCLRNTEVLTYLEIDGIPLYCNYIESLCQALKKNKTVKYLSFANSYIRDQGCEMLCRYLQFAPNIEVVNLMGCDLTSKSGEHLAKLIKNQQLSRYSESWHHSLRYANPANSIMRGVKRITLNCNPNFGDEGFDHILNELEDDLWIKALDLQRCSITENLSKKMCDIIHYNQSLEIVDLRQNDFLNSTTIEKVLQLLRDKQQLGFKPEFQWCNTALTLSLDSINRSVLSMGTTIHKTKSAPTKVNFSTSTLTSVRKARTLDHIPGTMPKNMISELNIKLQSEIQKRKSIEAINKKLLHKLEATSSVRNTSRRKQPLKVVVNGEKKPKSIPKTKNPPTTTTKNGGFFVVVVPTTTTKNPPIEAPTTTNIKNKFQVAIKPLLMNGTKNGFKIKNGVKKKDLGNGAGVAIKPLLMNGTKNGFKIKNGVKKKDLGNGAGDSNGYKNGFSSLIYNSAHKIFENIMSQSGSGIDSSDDEELLNYYINDKMLEQDADNSSPKSQESLYKYLVDLRNDTNEKT